MAAANGYVTLTADTWTLVSATGASVSAITIINPLGQDLLIAGSATEVAPSDDSGAFPLLQGRGITSDLTLAELFPGVTGVGYVYAKSVGADHRIFRSHA